MSPLRIGGGEGGKEGKRSSGCQLSLHGATVGKQPGKRKRKQKKKRKEQKNTKQNKLKAQSSEHTKESVNYLTEYNM